MNVVYYFIFDCGDTGEYFRMGIACENRLVAEGYLQEYSNDVRFHECKEDDFLKKGKEIAIGHIVDCCYVGDKCCVGSSELLRSLPPDSRHKAVVD